jgi:periplasmic divalent cation tolerance protein
MTDLVLLLTTMPGGEAGEHIARTVVEERLAACASLLPPMVSLYRWKGEVQREEERQLLIKSTREALPALQARLAALHPYEVPEMLVVAIDDASEPYGAWVQGEVGRRS